MALTDDSTTSSTNSGGIASALTALNSASSNVYVICFSDRRRCPIFAVIARALRLCTAGIWGLVYAVHNPRRWHSFAASLTSLRFYFVANNY
eukprot:scaffold33540_cov116-Skeletonema_dohrnii-CCMP3373.AAC.3